MVTVMILVTALISKIVQNDEYFTRFFGTKWNSLISISRKRTPCMLGKRGLYFSNGFAEIYIGSRWKIRYRNAK
jgi:hypothetical protein